MRGDFVRVAVIAESPDCAKAVVAININTVKSRIFLAAINVAADDAHTDAVVGKYRLRQKSWLMRVVHDRFDILRAGRAGFVLMAGFKHAPAVVAAFDNDIHS